MEGMNTSRYPILLNRCGVNVRTIRQPRNKRGLTSRPILSPTVVAFLTTCGLKATSIASFRTSTPLLISFDFPPSHNNPFSTGRAATPARCSVHAQKVWSPTHGTTMLVLPARRMAAVSCASPVWRAAHVYGRSAEAGTPGGRRNACGGREEKGNAGMGESGASRTRVPAMRADSIIVRVRASGSDIGADSKLI
jgi:hypothetical protein